MSFRKTAVLGWLVCFISWPIAHAADSAAAHQPQASLDSATASQVLYLHDQEKLALDLNWEFLEKWSDPVFQSLGALERSHKDELFVLMKRYGLEPLVTTGTEGEYGIAEHTDAYLALHERGWESLLGAYLATAYVEEWDISEIRALIDSTDERPLRDTLTKLLSGAQNHLRMLVSHVAALGLDYQAQLLSQAHVDDICTGVEAYTDSNFTFNSGLNDAWYYPLTAGQGFFVSVYPSSKTVFVSWMSYDTSLPEPDAFSNVGDAGQRWLIAEGTYEGNRAELVVFSTSGGLFDKVGSDVELEYIGDMVLQFDDCSSGSVWYALWPLWGGYMLPIQRVAPDSIQTCEMFSQD